MKHVVTKEKLHSRDEWFCVFLVFTKVFRDDLEGDVGRNVVSIHQRGNTSENLALGGIGGSVQSRSGRAKVSLKYYDGICWTKGCSWSITYFPSG